MNIYEAVDSWAKCEITWLTECDLVISAIFTDN